MNAIINNRNNPWTLFNDGVFRLFDDFAYPTATRSRPVMRDFPKCDVEETDKYYLISFDLPGLKKEQLNLEVKDGVLTVSGERKGELKNGGYSERFYGSFERSFTLPEGVESDRVEAHFEDGVLTVALPKPEAKTAKKIEIGQGESGKSFFSKLIGHVKKEDHAA